MYWQWEQLRSGAAWQVGGTFIEDKLPVNGHLSALMFHAYKGAVNDSMIAAQKWRMLDYISKLEIVAAGSDDPFNLTGQCAHYVQWLKGGGAAPDKHFNYGTSTKRAHGLILFGRYLYDMDFGLDLSRWKNIQPQFTNDAAVAQFTADWNLDLWALWLRDAPAGQFKGYIETKEWRKITTVQAKTEYLQLPAQDRLRSLILQVSPAVDANFEAKITPYNVAKKLTFTKRSGQHSLFEGSLRDLWYVDYFKDGRDVFAPLESYHTNDKGIWTGLGQTIGEAGLRLEHSGLQSLVGTTIKPGDDSSTLVRQVDTDSDQDAILAMGMALENCAYFPIETNWDPSEWLDLAAEATTELDVETADDANAASGTVRVILERARSFPMG